jgi:hypothetical protein
MAIDAAHCETIFRVVFDPAGHNPGRPSPSQMPNRLYSRA